MAYANILKGLADKQIILPILENQILADEWPTSYQVTVDSGPYYGLNPDGTPDGYFHPSTHSLMTARQLYYMFHPDHKHLVETEPWTLQRNMTLSVGTAIHSVLQTQMVMAGLTTWEDVEALACDTPILTVSGWSTMGELKEGDEVYAPDGHPTKVLVAHPISVGTCYEVRFQSGAVVVADAGHLWEVDDKVGGRAGNFVLKKTQELFQQSKDYPKGNRFSVRVASPVSLPERDLPIDPWLLGYWLGDGSATSPQFAVHGKDLGYFTGRLEDLGLEYSYCRSGRKDGDNYSVYVRGIHGLLDEVFGASAPICSECGKKGKKPSKINKRIPDAYMVSSITQRAELLRGLMDSDGTTAGHQVSLSQSGSVHGELLLDAFHLLRSLGYNARLKSDRVVWSASRGECPFGMPRKVKRFSERTPYAGRFRLDQDQIVSVSQVAGVPVRCITVAGSMFLAGRELVVTHNCEYINVEHHVRGRNDIVVKHPTEGYVPVEIKSRNGMQFDRTVIEDMPNWEIQLSLACDNLGKRYNTDFTYGILLMAETGFPFRLRELRVKRNDEMLAETYAKFDLVRDSIRTNTPPPHCCSMGGATMKSCRARHACWLRKDNK